MRNKPVGFIENLKEELSSLPNINSFKLWHGADFNLLFHASRLNCKEAVKCLLEKGADPALVNKGGTCILHLMAKKGQLDMAKMCLKKISLEDFAEKIIFLNRYSNIGYTPLMAAVENNHLDFVNWLLSFHVGINFRMRTGWTAMHAAAKRNNRKMLKILLERGGNKNIIASHPQFGRNLKVEDVTCDKQTLMILTSMM